MSSFLDLQIHPELLRALKAEGYDIPTPIQVDAIPPILSGSDVMGCAQTGTGKTAAFAVPILQHLMSEQKPTSTRAIRTLVLAPTRELAAQIFQSFNSYGRFSGMRFAVIFGGVKQGRQVDALRAGVDVLIATPGRLLDLMNQGYVRLDGLRHLVLDEADNMLDMGFIHDIRKVIAKCPKKRQTLMFSATMPAEIRQLAGHILHQPVHIQVAAESAAAETVQQAVVFVEKAQKAAMLVHYLQGNGVQRVLVFARTKHGADKVAKQLLRSGIRAMAIHGNKSQNARTRAITDFKGQEPPVLVATDIAARGLDIDEVSHVVNFDLPNVPETYVHRIGRTGRAGASGKAISFCDPEERTLLRDIEKLTRIRIPVLVTPRDLPEIKPAPSSHGPHAEQPKPFRHEPRGEHPRQQSSRQQPARQQSARQQSSRPQQQPRRDVQQGLAKPRQQQPIGQPRRDPSPDAATDTAVFERQTSDRQGSAWFSAPGRAPPDRGDRLGKPFRHDPEQCPATNWGSPDPRPKATGRAAEPTTIQHRRAARQSPTTAAAVPEALTAG